MSVRRRHSCRWSDTRNHDSAPDKWAYATGLAWQDLARRVVGDPARAETALCGQMGLDFQSQLDADGGAKVAAKVAAGQRTSTVDRREHVFSERMICRHRRLKEPCQRGSHSR